MWPHFLYSDLDYYYGLYSYALFHYDSYQHNYYVATMDTFDSEYLFGNFLEDSKFDELRET